MKSSAAVLTFALAFAAAPAWAAGPASPEDFQRATERIVALVEAAQQVPGASPGFAVVAVPAQGEPVIWVQGQVRAGGPAATADTPFYIASMTKAYMGLTAAELDREGVLDLDTTLAEVWPDLELPEGADPAAVTLRQLLGHEAPFANGALSFRTAYTDEVAVADYPRLLSTASQPREPGFAYSNLSYLTYAAALEHRTGRSWRDWLRAQVLEPLDLDHTSSRASDFPAGSVTDGHQWTGDGWVVAPVKADAVMHPAGGLVSSPADMARWLRAHLEGRGGDIAPEAFAAARAPGVAFELSNEGIPCTGYGLGWYVCEIGDAEVFAHGGGYTGFRSSMAFSTELGAGFAVLTNSDSMTGGLSAMLTRLFFTALADPDAELPAPEELAAQYAPRVARLATGRLQQAAEARASADWGGWGWRPDAAALAAYEGTWRSEALGDAVVSRGPDGLTVRLGVLALPLEPAAPDLFGAAASRLEPPAPVRFERDGAGALVALDWDGDRFVRVR